MKKILSLLCATALLTNVFAVLMTAKADEPTTTATPTVLGTSFEQLNVGDELDPIADDAGNKLDDGTQYEYHWVGAPGDTGTIKAYGEETPYEYSDSNNRSTAFTGDNTQYLALETSDRLLRTYNGIDTTALANGVTNAAPVSLADADLYADLLVKFTGSEERPASQDGDKIAVWFKTVEAENEEIVGETNLVITAGYFGTLKDGDYSFNEATDSITSTVTNRDYIVELTNPINPEKWYRLTIKAANNVMASGDKVPGFIVYLDGEPLAAKADSYDIGGGLDENSFDPANRVFFNAKQLFPSLVGSNNEDLEVTGLSLAGTGSIDDLSLNTLAPNFAVPDTMFTLTWAPGLASLTYAIDDNEPVAVDDLSSGKQVIPLEPGYAPHMITIAETYADGYKYRAGDWTADGANATLSEKTFSVIERPAGGVASGAIVPFKAFFEVGSTEYAVFSQAYDAAKNGGTITVVADAVIDDASGGIMNGSAVIDAGETVTIDLNGKTLTGNGANPAIVNLGGTLTIFGGTLAGTNGALNASDGMTTITSGTIGTVTGTSLTITGGSFLDANATSAADFYLKGAVNTKEYAISAPVESYLTVSPITKNFMIGDQYYATIADAIADAANGTIKFLEDCEISSLITLTSDVTLDFNGKNVTGCGKCFEIINDATLTVNATNSTVQNVRFNVGKQVVKGNGNPGNLVLNGGTYSITDNTIVHVNGDCQSAEDACSVTINDATLESVGDNTVQFNGNGTYAINNSSLTGATAIYLKAGELEIANSAITANGAFAAAIVDHNGSNATGDAIVIDASKGYAGNVSLVFGEGDTSTVTSENGYAVRETLTDASASAMVDLEIAGGTFTGNAEKGAISVTDTFLASLEGDEATGTSNISGGSFSSSFPAALCVTGLVPGYDADGKGKWAPEEGFSITFVTDHGTAPDPIYCTTREYPDGYTLSKANLPNLENVSGFDFNYWYTFEEGGEEPIPLDWNPEHEDTYIGEEFPIYWTATVTALWTSTEEPEQKPFDVIIAGETKGYDTFAEALAEANAAIPSAKIVLNEDVTTVGKLAITGNVTLDLNGKTIAQDQTVAKANNSGVLIVAHGGTLTIDDSSNPSTGMIDGGAKAYAAVAMTGTGDTDATNPATLVVNAGTLQGHYYGIVGNGNAGRGNTSVTVNGGLVQGTNAGDCIGIYNPQEGTVTVAGGTVKGDTGIYAKAGTISVTGGEVIGNGAAKTPNPNGNGADPTGDAIVLDTKTGYAGQMSLTLGENATVTSANGFAVRETVTQGDKSGTLSIADNGATLAGELGGLKVSDDFTAAIDDGTATIAGYTYAVDGVCIKGTLSDAIAAVADNGTITLLADVPNATGIAINTKKTFTVDFNGFTYTVNKPGAGSTGTTKAAFQLLKGQTVTFKNGTIQAAADNLVKATLPNMNIYRFIQNYANLTLENMTFDATNLYIDPEHAADYFPSAVEVCYGTVALTGSTAINDKTGLVSLTVDTYKTAAYKEGADVTINTTGTIASVFCYSEGTYTMEGNTSLTLEAGTIGALTVDGNDEVDVTKTGATVTAPEGYEWDETTGELKKVEEPTGLTTLIAGTPYDAETNPYVIRDAADFAILQADVAKGADSVYGSATIVLTNDVDMTAAGAWEGIGTIDADYDSQLAFKGTLDGLYEGVVHKIYNLNLKGNKYSGLFNLSVGATFKNLEVVVAGITKGEKIACSTFGSAYEGTFYNITTRGNVMGADYKSAGMAAKCFACTFTSCTNYMNISSSQSAAGFCFAASSAPSWDVAEGKNTKVYEGFTVFTDCVNYGDMTGALDGGQGVAGFVAYGQGGSYGPAFSNCVNYGTIKTTADDVGGSFVGTRAGTTVKNLGGNSDTQKLNMFGYDNPTTQNHQIAFNLYIDEADARYWPLENQVVAGKTYTLAANAKPVIELAKDESITFVPGDFTLTKTGIAAATGLEIEESPANTFTAVAPKNFQVIIAGESAGKFETLAEALAAIEGKEDASIQATLADVSLLPAGYQYTGTESPFGIAEIVIPDTMWFAEGNRSVRLGADYTGDSDGFITYYARMSGDWYLGACYAWYWGGANVARMSAALFSVSDLLSNGGYWAAPYYQPGGAAEFAKNYGKVITDIDAPFASGGAIAGSTQGMWKGQAQSATLGIGVIGQSYVYENKYTMVPLTSTAWTPETTSLLTLKDATSAIEGMDFNPAGTYLYALDSKKIKRWTVGATDTTADAVWELDATFEPVDISSLVDGTMMLRVYNVGGKDLVYFFAKGCTKDGAENKIKYYVLDTTDGSVATLVNREPKNKDIVTTKDKVEYFGEFKGYQNVAVSGLGTDNAFLYVEGGYVGIEVYALSADGKSVKNENPVCVIDYEDSLAWFKSLKTFNEDKKDNAVIYSLDVTEDGTTAVMTMPVDDIYGNRILTVGAPYMIPVTVAAGEGVTAVDPVSTNILPGTTLEIAITPAAGKTLFFVNGEEVTPVENVITWTAPGMDQPLSNMTLTVTAEAPKNFEVLIAGESAGKFETLAEALAAIEGKEGAEIQATLADVSLLPAGYQYTGTESPFGVDEISVADDLWFKTANLRLAVDSKTGHATGFFPYYGHFNEGAMLLAAYFWSGLTGPQAYYMNESDLTTKGGNYVESLSDVTFSKNFGEANNTITTGDSAAGWQGQAQSGARGIGIIGATGGWTTPGKYTVVLLNETAWTKENTAAVSLPDNTSAITAMGFDAAGDYLYAAEGSAIVRFAVSGYGQDGKFASASDVVFTRDATFGAVATTSVRAIRVYDVADKTLVYVFENVKTGVGVSVIDASAPAPASVKIVDYAFTDGSEGKNPYCLAVSGLGTDDAFLYAQFAAKGTYVFALSADGLSVRNAFPVESGILPVNDVNSLAEKIPGFKKSVYDQNTYPYTFEVTADGKAAVYVLPCDNGAHNPCARTIVVGAPYMIPVTAAAGEGVTSATIDVTEVAPAGKVEITIEAEAMDQYFVNGEEVTPVENVITWTAPGMDQPLSNMVLTVTAKKVPLFPRPGTEAIIGQDGSAEHPWAIADVDDLQAIQKAVADGLEYADDCFIQIADIDMDGIAWTGIGEAGLSKAVKGTNKAFAGTYDGNGKTIKNVTFAAQKYQGIFNIVMEGTIKNLNVEFDGFVAGASGSYGAAVIGHACHNTIVSNVVASGSLSATHNVAGIVIHVQDEGTATAASCIGPKFYDCVNNATIATTYTKAAGIAANVDAVAEFHDCSNTAAISTTKSTNDGGIAGIVGYGSQDILFDTCSNSGVITGDALPNGDLIGFVNTGNCRVTMDDCSFRAAAKSYGTLGNGAPAPAGSTYALVSGDVATTVAADALAAGNTYTLYAAAKPAIELDVGDSITFDKNGFDLTATGIAPAEGAKLNEPVEAGDVVTYSASEASTDPLPPAANDAAVQAILADAPASLKNNITTKEDYDAFLKWVENNCLLHEEVKDSDMAFFSYALGQDGLVEEGAVTPETIKVSEMAMDGGKVRLTVSIDDITVDEDAKPELLAKIFGAVGNDELVLEDFEKLNVKYVEDETTGALMEVQAGDVVFDVTYADKFAPGGVAPKAFFYRAMVDTSAGLSK